VANVPGAALHDPLRLPGQVLSKLYTCGLRLAQRLQGRRLKSAHGGAPEFRGTTLVQPTWRTTGGLWVPFVEAR
jgi:hypothetical protein